MTIRASSGITPGYLPGFGSGFDAAGTGGGFPPGRASRHGTRFPRTVGRSAAGTSALQAEDGTCGHGPAKHVHPNRPEAR